LAPPTPLRPAVEPVLPADDPLAPPTPLRPAVEPVRPAEPCREGRFREPSEGAEAGLPPWSPYAAGFGLGLVLLLAFCVLGTGPDASGALARATVWLESRVTPAHVAPVAGSEAWSPAEPSSGGGHYLLFLAGGTCLGGLLSAAASRRVVPGVERGPRSSVLARLCLALSGGLLAGFASQLARGCPAGQALTGAALFFTGSAVVLGCFLVGGYVVAPVVRREWR